MNDNNVEIDKRQQKELGMGKRLDHQRGKDEENAQERQGTKKIRKYWKGIGKRTKQRHYMLNAVGSFIIREFGREVLAGRKLMLLGARNRRVSTIDSVFQR